MKQWEIVVAFTAAEKSPVKLNTDRTRDELLLGVQQDQGNQLLPRAVSVAVANQSGHTIQENRTGSMLIFLEAFGDIGPCCLAEDRRIATFFPEQLEVNSQTSRNRGVWTTQHGEADASKYCRLKRPTEI